MIFTIVRIAVITKPLVREASEIVAMGHSLAGTYAWDMHVLIGFFVIRRRKGHRLSF